MFLQERDSSQVVVASSVSSSVDVPERRRPKTRYATAPGGVKPTIFHRPTGPRTDSDGRLRMSRCARKMMTAATIHPIAIRGGEGRL